MGALEKVKEKILQKTVIQGYDKYFNLVLTLVEVSYKGTITYEVVSRLDRNDKFSPAVEYFSSLNKETCVIIFFRLRKKYLNKQGTRKIF